jgi:hypothetical protein
VGARIFNTSEGFVALLLGLPSQLANCTIVDDARQTHNSNDFTQPYRIEPAIEFHESDECFVEK